MTVDPLGDLRRLRDAAMDSVHGTGPAAEYERGAMQIAWSDLTGEGRASLLDDTLRVEMKAQQHVAAHTLAQVADGVQNATARVARWQIEPEADPAAKISKSDRARARVIQDMQVGNVAFYRIESTPADGLDVPQQETSAQIALRTLLEYLPEREDDDRAVDGILGSDPAVRLAVRDLSSAAKSAGGIEFDFESGGVTTTSVLTHPRAVSLVEELDRKVDHTYTDSVHGVLDGMRGTRHVFYLIQDNRNEVSGAASDALLAKVRALIGKRVRAQLEVVERLTASGRARKSYRLIDIEAEPTLLDD